MAKHGQPEKSPEMEGRVMYVLLNPIGSKV
jgi:hypothetical protein